LAPPETESFAVDFQHFVIKWFIRFAHSVSKSFSPATLARLLQQLSIEIKERLLFPTENVSACSSGLAFWCLRLPDVSRMTAIVYCRSLKRAVALYRSSLTKCQTARSSPLLCIVQSSGFVLTMATSASVVMYLITGQPGFSVVPFTWIERFLVRQAQKNTPAGAQSGGATRDRR